MTFSIPRKSALCLLLSSMSGVFVTGGRCLGQSATVEKSEQAAVEMRVTDAFVPCSSQHDLLDGYLGRRMEINLERRLLQLDLDSILLPFEKRPGQQMWVGEHVGKWLHAASLYWEQTRDPRIKTKMDQTARRLIATQLEDGYLGTYKPEDHWTSWDVWSHKYNLIGLLAYYNATGNPAALQASRKIGDLLCRTFGEEEGQIDIIVHSTHVGMAATSVLEPMVNLYRFTGEQRYRKFCDYILIAWEHPHGPHVISSLLDHGNVFRTANRKAYEMTSCLVGLLEFYRVTGNPQHLRACVNAWEDIKANRLYLIGSASWGEHFTGNGQLRCDGMTHQSGKYQSTCEGCVTVTWLQFNWHLLRLTGKARYADELERTVYNSLLAAQSPANGAITYFLPLLGDRKRYGEVTHGIEPDVCCCASSVPRGIAMIPEIAVGTIDEDPTVVLYTSGVYTCNAGGAGDRQLVTLRIRTDYPAEEQVGITVEPEREGEFTLALHVPSWCNGYQAEVAGEVVTSDLGRFLRIQRKWRKGDVVNITLPMKPVIIPNPGGTLHPDKVAVQRGPQVLAVDHGAHSSQLPPEWVGNQVYAILARRGEKTSPLVMVPFADAGQLGADYDVLVDAFSLSDRPVEDEQPDLSQLDPRSERHIPIGVINSRDALKTFVEPEGTFSPGVGSYGVSYWLYDKDAGRLTAPTMDDVDVQCGLMEGELLIPWSRWKAGDVNVRTEVCQTVMKSPMGDAHVVASRIRLLNTSDRPKEVFLYAALRSLGPAGGPIRVLASDPAGDALLVDGHAALVAVEAKTQAGVADDDTVGIAALQGQLPTQTTASSQGGDCSGAVRYSVLLAPGRAETLAIVCPVLPGRRISSHQWESLPGQNAMVDTAGFAPGTGDVLLPDAGLDFYRGLDVDAIFKQTVGYWHKNLGPMRVKLPDERWDHALRAILGHAAMCLNENAPDVAVVNYNVYNRDGMYIANMMQKTGLPSWSEKIIDYFVANPFNGRPFPEADNPGQVLFSIAEHWRMTRDSEWLQRIYPSVQKIAGMIAYYRTSPGPHWVEMTGLRFGDDVPVDQRRELIPGRCDGQHPEYTEAFDIVGLRDASGLAAELGKQDDADRWSKLAQRCLEDYSRKFGTRLQEGYGSYSVLWPCRLYPLGDGPAHQQFCDVGPQPLSQWRYFAPAKAHQSLLAGNRDAGWKSVNVHLDHPQMRDWFALDEGGLSGSGGWHHLRTNWKCDRNKPGRNGSVAMPHGWAIAEVWLLMRDSLLFEKHGQLCLLPGVDPEWFRSPEGMRVENLATAFGPCSFMYQRTNDGATLELDGAAPPGGFVLCLPPELGATARANGLPLPQRADGSVVVQTATKHVNLSF